ncbi:zinc-binding dehydrogenase [Mycobacterium kubicae]|uniref:zinc-binding dehydrogenase n=1 Tax=Mycobacterium kubicae TaxID=120959 RepID=UPI0009ECE978|nr:zinc-binding dehydrogenase [Mycobacterium kubicae]
MTAATVAARYARWDGVGQPITVVKTSTTTDPGPGRVLVAIDLATVCGSDLHTVHGRRSAPHPSILGHEQVGHVTAIGSGAQPRYFGGAEVNIGDRVVWSVTASCGRCRNCARGFEQKCSDLKKYGHEALDNGWPLNGGFASHCVLVPGTTIVPVPDSVPDAVAAPASCATATVAAVLDAAALNRSSEGTRVLITGAGMLGVTAAAMANALGARVTVCDPDPARREVAAGFGADLVVADALEIPPVDVALELSGSSLAVQACIARLDVGGCAVLAGTVAASRNVSIDPEHLVRRLITLTGVHNYRPVHLHTAVEFLVAYQHRYPFADLVAAPAGLDQLDATLHSPPHSSFLRQSLCPTA